ncbi:SpoIID/LytB domain-containing protein [Synechococcus sp. LA31]|uniref:SpoIID/LytB domain-containing protein n=1 Tax=Synechococcus sp. LA31 TaxID=2741953 RepID=UPI001BDBCEC7|nr:SpoIID/LytB domain-containing protein [Synechococcus sp. LA31]QVV67140.1 SpoIID/LytB domain-containing protein [Synechococcus sp. LA31]
MATLRVLPALLSLSLLVLSAGCQGAGAESRTRLPVPEPPAVDGQRPVLWVSLAARLGAEPLRLEAASGALQLVDGRGERFSSARLQLRWLSQPLADPVEIRRSVMGPFSSFEGAEQAALAWSRAGVTAEVAHPRDWEVWAAPGAAPPEGYAVRQVQQRLTQQRVLQVQTPAGWRNLASPVQLQAPGGLRFKGGVFAGPFRLQSDAYGSWTLVEQVPLERYLQGVVPHEIGAGSPAAALAAQAVLARTWALRNQHRFLVDGYHLCSDTQCQVYSDPRQAGPAVRQAVSGTAGRVLAAEGKPIHAVYHASNGGVSADEDEAWPLPELRYLEPALDLRTAPPQGVSLPLDSDQEVALLLARRSGVVGASHPLFRWRRQLDQASLRQGLGASGAGLGSPLKPVVLERGPSGRVVRLAIQGPQGQVVLERDAIRRTYRQLPSTLFVLRPAGGGAWSVVGGGFGHGAGLSQAGAIDLARRGWTVDQILSRYYPGAQLVPIQSLAGANGGAL